MTGRDTVLQGCAFETERLRVKDWRALSPADWRPRELSAVVASLLTEPVTRPLPEAWQGTY